MSSGERSVQESGIVVGVDGSERAVIATEWAAEEAALRGLGLRIVYCRSGRSDTKSAVFETGDSAPELRAATEAARAAAPQVTIATQSVTGDPLAQLLEFSRGAALMVVGAPERLSVSRSSGGSTAAALATYGHCPLVIVRQDPRSESLEGWNQVVAGTDGSGTSEAALSFAFAAAASRQVDLDVVMTWTDIEFDAGTGFRVRSVSEAAVAAERAVTAQIARIAPEYPQVAVHPVLVQDRPVRALLRRAEGALLLVVGSHGGTGVIGMAIGSTSRTLLYESPCPVAIVRPWYP